MRPRARPACIPAALRVEVALVPAASAPAATGGVEIATVACGLADPLTW